MEKATKVSKEVALKEVEKWLDYKRVDEKKRADSKDNIEALADAIAFGYLVLDKDFNLVHSLKFPLLNEDGSVAAKEFKYKPRLKAGDVQNRTQNIKATDTFALIGAYVSALTDLNSGMVKQLDTEDYRIAQAIAIFFL